MINQWSISRLSTWESCPAKAKFKFVDKIHEMSGPQAERGTVIHSFIEGYLNGTVDNLPPEVKADMAPVYDILKEQKPLTEHKIGFTREWTETKFFAPDVWLRAVYDVIYYDEEGKCVVIVDHKTGKVYPKHREQLELYSATGLLLFPEATEAVAKNYYTDIGLAATLSYELKREGVPVVLEKWTNRVAKMEADDKFPANPSAGCRWCSFRRSNGGPCSFG